MNLSSLRRCGGSIALLSTLLLPAIAAAADERGPIARDLNADLGGFFMDFDTDVRLDGESGPGDEVSFRDDLGLTDQDLFRIDAFWRFADRHKVRLMYFDYNRANNRTLSRDIEYGDTTFPVNADARGEVDEQIFEIAYEYAFLQRDDLELSGSIGIHDIRIKASLEADVTSPGGGGSTQLAETADGNGPLPVLGLHLLWDMGAHFYLEGLVQFFALEYDNYDGSLEDYKLGVTWFPTTNFGLGIAYNKFASRLDVTDDDFTGKLRIEYGGPMAYVTVAF